MFALVVCLVVSFVPIWQTWDSHKSAVRIDDRGVFWEESTHALFGDRFQPGIYAVHNLRIMALIGILAYLVGGIAFWFGPRVKDKDDIPPRPRVPDWEM